MVTAPSLPAALLPPPPLPSSAAPVLTAVPRALAVQHDRPRIRPLRLQAMGPSLLRPSRPVASLTALFVLWKGFLLVVALAAVADYDTSTALFLARLDAPVPAVAARLTRWDAIYFVDQARHGYGFEQQWAFAAALPRLVRALVSLLPAAAPEPLVAVAVAHASHLVAVLALHRLALVLCADARLALVAAALHVVSPAGLFLSAPYAESPFAALSFVGSLLFALGVDYRRRSVTRAAAIVAAGVLLGLATAFRSNGLSHGLLFAAASLRRLVAAVRRPRPSSILALAAPVAGGICVAAGSVVPQVVAWQRYCRDVPAGLEPRPWCSRTVPSIYAFVQSEYW